MSKIIVGRKTYEYSSENSPIHPNLMGKRTSISTLAHDKSVEFSVLEKL